MKTGSLVVPQELSEEQPKSIPQARTIHEIPVVVNSAVKSWISYFQNRGRRHMEKYLRRSTRYEDLMKKVLREEGLPEDLIYVPLIESGFSSNARSHRSAVGYWQFIRDTGRRYGLKINRYVDERSDPLLSTRAAAGYFKALYSLFGDWYLSLAAYNTGENRVKRAIMREKTRDFWVLARKRRLHPETRNYVPKFLAAMLISKNPMKFGFVDVQYKAPLRYDRIYATQPVSLLKMARNMGVSVKTLRGLNPRYRTDYVPIYRGRKSLVRVPKGHMLSAHNALSKSLSKAPRYVPSLDRWHTVRRGQTLSGIALRYGVRVSSLRSVNRLRRRSIIRVGQRLKVPGRGRSVVRRGKRKKNADYHTVRRGQTLSGIALRYGVRVSSLRSVNGLRRRSVIKAGQRLKIPKQGTRAADRGQGGKKRGSSSYHIVRRGESLSKISHRYGVSINTLKRLNKMGRSSIVKIGQKLWLGDKSKSRSIHVVRRGDTLLRLAQRYKVSLKRLIAINSLRRSSKLRIGRELIIP